MKGYLCLFMFFLHMVINAQNKGIKWVEGLKWMQVVDKAKIENKYIFLDCFATWCGPCKKMNKEVYVNDSIGRYFNDKFISVKVQMDKTKNDNEHIKSWYQDADAIAKQYKVTVFPTYIFLSSNGVIVHKETGFKGINDFITIAQIAAKPGHVYNDPYTEYERLIDNYRLGKKVYGQMPYLIRTARDLNNWKLVDTLTMDYCNYLLGIKQELLYSKEYISFISSIDVKLLKNKFLKMFYPDGKKVDFIMNEKGYAQKVVDKIIQKEDVDPFINNVSAKRGMQIMYLKTPKDLSQLNWKKLADIIRKKYNDDYAKRNVLDAKIGWYSRYAIYSEYIKNFIIRLKKYGVDQSELEPDIRLNWVAWDVFDKITNKRQIKIAIKWMKDVVKRSPNAYMYFDTYANLLYKSGRKEEALHWEKKAFEGAVKNMDEIGIKSYGKNIEKIKRGEPTWSLR